MKSVPSKQMSPATGYELYHPYPAHKALEIHQAQQALKAQGTNERIRRCLHQRPTLHSLQDFGYGQCQ